MKRTPESLQMDAVLAAQLGKMGQDNPIFIERIRESQGGLRSDGSLTVRGQFIRTLNEGFDLTSLDARQTDFVLARHARLPYAQFALTMNLVEVRKLDKGSADLLYGRISKPEAVTVRLGNLAAAIDTYTIDDWHKILLEGKNRAQDLIMAADYPRSPFAELSKPLRNHLSAAVSEAFVKAAEVAYAGKYTGSEFMPEADDFIKTPTTEVALLTQRAALEALYQDALEERGYNFPHLRLFEEIAIKTETSITPAAPSNSEKESDSLINPLLANLLDPRNYILAGGITAGLLTGQSDLAEKFGLVSTARRDELRRTYEERSAQADVQDRAFFEEPAAPLDTRVKRLNDALSEKQRALKEAEAEEARVVRDRGLIDIGAGTATSFIVMGAGLLGLRGMEALRARKNRVRQLQTDETYPNFNTKIN